MRRVGGMVNGVLVWGMGGYAWALVRAVAVVCRARGCGLVERGGRGLVGMAVHGVIWVHGIWVWRPWVRLKMSGKGGRGLWLGLLADV